MKRIVIIGMLLMLALNITACSMNTNDELNQESSNEEITLGKVPMLYVDNTIASYVKSDSFQNSNIDERINGMRGLLDSLLQDNFIRDYNIYDKSNPVRVEYTYMEGEVGCIFLSDINLNQN